MEELFAAFPWWEIGVAPRRGYWLGWSGEFNFLGGHI
jgi:hypothetical protein